MEGLDYKYDKVRLSLSVQPMRRRMKRKRRTATRPTVSRTLRLNATETDLADDVTCSRSTRCVFPEWRPAATAAGPLTPGTQLLRTPTHNALRAGKRRCSSTVMLKKKKVLFISTKWCCVFLTSGTNSDSVFHCTFLSLDEKKRCQARSATNTLSSLPVSLY